MTDQWSALWERLLTSPFTYTTKMAAADVERRVKSVLNLSERCEGV